MHLRCRAGDLAEIIRSEAGNEGRRVVVERPGHPGRDGFEWVVLPLQPLRQVLLIGGFHAGHRFTLERGCFPDTWLRPIRPDADGRASDTQLDVELQAHGLAHG
jgi:hypothetical protein